MFIAGQQVSHSMLGREIAKERGNLRNQKGISTTKILLPNMANATYKFTPIIVSQSSTPLIVKSG